MPDPLPEALALTPVDPYDTEAVGAWHSTYAEALRHGRDPAAATVWTLAELQVQLQDPSDRKWQQAWAGRTADRGGQVVVAGMVEGHNRHNLGSAEVFVGTLPDSRGRGFGGLMLARLEQVALERDRRLLSAMVDWTYDAADPTGAGVADLGWAQRRGYRLGLVDVQRQLRLPVADELIDRLTAEAAPRHHDYRLRSFPGPVPEDLLPGWVALSSSLMTEAPMGEIERDVQGVDLPGYRESEAMVARQGRTKFNTVALDAGGEVVAYSDIAVSAHDPGKAYQWGTLVRRDHRGHRLGMAVKLANLRLLQGRGPALHTLVTYNAEVNAHMVGVNDELGFVPVERSGELQKRL